LKGPPPRSRSRASNAISPVWAVVDESPGTSAGIWRETGMHSSRERGHSMRTAPVGAGSVGVRPPTHHHDAIESGPGPPERLHGRIAHSGAARSSPVAFPYPDPKGMALRNAAFGSDAAKAVTPLRGGGAISFETGCCGGFPRSAPVNSQRTGLSSRSKSRKRGSPGGNNSRHGSVPVRRPVRPLGARVFEHERANERWIR